ncbi:MAG TPA: PIG-L family deacetylase [Thermoanaerobacterales bacterium]|nr:PIG-L family deacetylase [Thermoanaerobacterales bacterium]
MALRLKMKKRVMVLFVLLALIFIYSMGFLAYFYTNAEYAIGSSRDKLYVEPLNLGDRILIIVPHPDDENIGMGGLIFNEHKRGKKIKIVIVTNGDGFKRAVKESIRSKRISPEDFVKLGLMRQQETISAMKTLGLSESDIVFLGYADGSINSLWDMNWDYKNAYMGLNGHTSTPYSNSFDKNAVYCGKNLVKDLKNIIDDFKPTDIFYPDPDDVHRDHWAVSNFVKFTVELYDYRANMYTYLVHHYQWPEPWALLPAAGLYPPLSMEEIGTKWHIYKLSPEAEKAKGTAMKEYKTQFKVMGAFLDAFVRKNELFGTYNNKVYKKIDGVPDFKKGDELPYQVITASISDNPLLRIEGNDDLKAAGFVENLANYYFAIETRGKVEKTTDYTIDAIFIYKDKNIKRLKVYVRNFKANITVANDEGDMLVKKQLPVSVYDRRLWFAIPKSYLGEPERVFFNAVTSIAGKYIDKTAWTMVER